MPTIERPLARDAPDIIGTFVLVSLDPVASVAALNDEKAMVEAAGLSTKRYLALVKNYLDFQGTEEGPKLTLDFSPGACGLPSPPHSWAAVPVAPATAKGECTRQPVNPNVPLPWDNCYLYTLHFTGGTVSRIHQADHQGPRLSEDAQTYVFTAQYEDRRKVGLAERARRAEEAARLAEEAARLAEDAVRLQSPGPPEADSPVSQEPAPVPKDVEERHVTAGATEVEEYDEQALMEELFQQDDVPHMTPHFEIWLDLSTWSPEILGKPAQIQSEIEKLERIEWEWAQRTVAGIMSKGPETNAWLDSIGEADVPPQSAGIDVAFDDGLVVPEDAIEHRMEQGKLPPMEVREAISPDRLGSVTGPQLTGSSSSSISEINAVDEHEDSPDGRNKPVSPSGMGGLSVFRMVMRGVASFAFRLKSLLWGLIWRKPTAAR